MITNAKISFMNSVFLLIFVLCVSAIQTFAQYYIGQKKITELRHSKKVSLGEEPTGKTYQVYLLAVQKYGGYISDVRIGFDKLKYSRNDKIILTFSRSGENKSVKNELVTLIGKNNIKGIGFNLKKDGRGIYSFELGSDEQKQVIIHLQNSPEEDLDKIHIRIGKFFNEAYSFIIPFPPNKNSNIKKPIIKLYPKKVLGNSNNFKVY